MQTSEVFQQVSNSMKKSLNAMVHVVRGKQLQQTKTALILCRIVVLLLLLKGCTLGDVTLTIFSYLNLLDISIFPQHFSILFLRDKWLISVLIVQQILLLQTVL